MSKIDEWRKQDKLILLEGWARQGLTNEQIANNIGIGRTTLYEWSQKEPNIANAIKKGKEVVDFEVENALLKRALGYKYVEVTKEKVKNPITKEYEMVVTKEITKEVQPDTTAQIFWLKNRMTKQWRDKVEVEANKEQLEKVNELLTKIKEEANDNN